MKGDHEFGHHQKKSSGNCGSYRNGYLDHNEHVGLRSSTVHVGFLAGTPYRHRARDSNADAHEDAQTNFHAHGDLHAHTGGDTHAHRHGYPHRNPYPCGDRHANTYSGAAHAHTASGNGHTHAATRHAHAPASHSDPCS